jgi:hypothetical protein
MPSIGPADGAVRWKSYISQGRSCIGNVEIKPDAASGSTFFFIDVGAKDSRNGRFLECHLYINLFTSNDFCHQDCCNKLHTIFHRSCFDPLTIDKLPIVLLY